MTTVSSPQCPKCKGKRTHSHCKSKTCTWSTCNPCSAKLEAASFVFDTKNRTMRGMA